MDPARFLLGIHHPNWLWNPDNTVPMFPSYSSLSTRKTG